MDIRADMTTSDPALARIIRRLVTAYEPEQIFLFGSRARGDPGPDSDYDLLLVVRTTPYQNGNGANWRTRFCGERARLPT